MCARLGGDKGLPWGYEAERLWLLHVCSTWMSDSKTPLIWLSKNLVFDLYSVRLSYHRRIVLLLGRENENLDSCHERFVDSHCGMHSAETG